MPPSLDTLPPEILFAILSYSSPFNASLAPRHHPLRALAATSTHLRSVVEEYCRSLLKRYAQITPPKTGKSFLCHRKWLRWLTTTCHLCGKSSKRKAILDPSLTCCAACDKKAFAKMTMTAAITTHHLSKLDLFTPNALHPALPPLSLGTYFCMGGETLMLAAPGVLTRKAHVHGLLGPGKARDKGYLRRRVAAHDRLVAHMDVEFRVRGGVGRW
ncbi:hypothetical protein BU26DRAFT_444364, partial [Trematosphaeria pertusa]